MSQKNQLVSLERRVKRMLGKHRLDLLKPQKPDPRVLEHGGYKLRDEITGKIVFGETPYPFSATLDEIEDYVAKLRGGGEDH